MKIKSFVFNPFQENTYIIYDATKECVIIDPGCYSEAEKNTLKQFIENKKLKPVKLINTHCHIDHILGNKFTVEEWDIKLHIHKADLPLIENAGEISRMYNLTNYEGSPYPKKFLSHGDLLTFGENSFKILFTPDKYKLVVIPSYRTPEEVIKKANNIFSDKIIFFHLFHIV